MLTSLAYCDVRSKTVLHADRRGRELDLVDLVEEEKDARDVSTNDENWALYPLANTKGRFQYRWLDPGFRPEGCSLPSKQANNLMK